MYTTTLLSHGLYLINLAKAANVKQFDIFKTNYLSRTTDNYECNRNIMWSVVDLCLSDSLVFNAKTLIHGRRQRGQLPSPGLRDFLILVIKRAKYSYFDH